MTTYRTMIDRIADEVGDSSVEGQIKRAIQSAIRTWERKRFYFNQSVGLVFATAADREYYGAADLAQIPDLIAIDWMTVTIDGVRCAVQARDVRDLEREQDGANKGDPYWFAYVAQQIRLHPIPHAARPIAMGAHYRLAPLVNDTDSNAWMTDAEELVRLEARLILARDVHKDAREVALLTTKPSPDRDDPITEAANALFAETRRRMSNDVLRVPAMPVARGGFSITRGY
jgi:hypothetical protein